MLTAKTAPSLVLEPVLDLPRILVVDDEELICDLIFELLEGEFGHVAIEKDGLRALDRLESEPFDLVLTDLKLGPTDGMMILERALGFHPEVAVILMTGFPTLENAVYALKAGAYDYITKPFSIESLRAVVRRALEHVRLQRENIQLREMINLKRITEALGSTLELNEVLQVVLESALAEARADFGAVMLDCKEQNRIRLASSLGGGQAAPDLEILLPFKDRMAWREGSQQAILLRADEVPPFTCPLLDRNGRRSAMNVPLRAKGEFIGVLHVSREKCPDAFTEGDLQKLQMIAAQATFAIENASLYDNLHNDYLAIIRALSNAVEAKDPYTRGHGDRVVKYTHAIGQRLGLAEEILEKLKVASILHDIGKIGIRDNILLKPGPLTLEEFDEMKLHPIIGDRILAPIRSLSDIRLWIYQHHERLDGKGYPERIGGADLTIPSRILIVAEVFDALVTDRAYKPAWSMEKVINFLNENADTHFDREMVEILTNILHREGESFYRENVVVY